MRRQILKWWAGICVKRSWVVIGALFAVTILAAMCASRLKMNMHWADLLPERDPMAQEFRQILDEYKSASTAILVLQGEEQDIKRFADTVVPYIERITEYVKRVDYKLDKSYFLEHGFMLTRVSDLEQSKDLFTDLNLVPLLTSINDNFEKEYIADEEALSTRTKEDEAVRYLDGLHFWIGSMTRSLQDPSRISPILAGEAIDRLLLGDEYFVSQDKRTLLIIIKPTFQCMDIERVIPAVDTLQRLVDTIQRNFPTVRAGLTGTIPLARDEVSYSMNDMKLSSVIAIILVIGLFVLTFRVWSTPILAGLNLVIALIITAGASALFVGRLNIMTSMFAVILIGLGIDYAIHIISLYSERRAIDPDSISAMQQALIRSGPGIITGALTTAAAFFALAISVTRGIKELGIVLGTGIIIAMLTTLIGLPALLAAREKVSLRRNREPKPPRHIEFTLLGRFGAVINRHPVLFLGTGIVLTGALLYQTVQVQFDHNYLNMEPAGIPSVVLQDTIVQAFDMSPDFAMVTAGSIDESFAIAEKAKAMPAFGMIENIGDICPPEHIQQERQPHVLSIQRSVASSSKQRPLTKQILHRLSEELHRLEMNIYELSQMAYIGGQDRVDAACSRIIGDLDVEKTENEIFSLIELIRTDPHAARTLSTFQSLYMPLLWSRVHGMADPQLITLDEVPEHIKNRYMNDAGNQFLVTIYGRQHIWDMKYLRQFSDQLTRVEPRATGTPPMFIRLIDYIGSDGLRSTALTLVIVLFLLWVDFRSLRLALLGITPLILGGIWMVGILKTLGMMLTMVNVCGIPMIVGIGIDDGVHLLHRYKYEGLNRTSIVLKSTGKAILLTSLTTMVGFGCLMIARYRGFISLGALLVIGVAACFITTVTFIPAIIGLFRREEKQP
ncbi:MAG: MMPL family transporter [candidate division WOR-3 bacterium]|nr:MAG: MMPL family transporter [candidate division WOR-3 bacterium]